jgi:hypothetical protein
MTFDERVQAIGKFGFTDRQARFLVTVMLHAGVCVPRQYARFASTAYGHNVTRFFRQAHQARLCDRERLSPQPRGALSVHHQALYRAIGQPQSRYRRPVSARQAIGRVVFLFLVTSPFDADLRRFLQRHAKLLLALPGWTLQLLFLRRAAGMMSAFEDAAREELKGRCAPDTIAELKWYCHARRETSDLRARCHSDERFWQAHRAFATPRCQMLYNGELAYSRRSIPREQSLAEADEKRRELERDG